jgi:hypothetical protein
MQRTRGPGRTAVLENDIDMVKEMHCGIVYETQVGRIFGRCFMDNENAQMAVRTHGRGFKGKLKRCETLFT